MVFKGNIDHYRDDGYIAVILSLERIRKVSKKIFGAC